MAYIQNSTFRKFREILKLFKNKEEATRFCYLPEIEYKPIATNVLLLNLCIMVIPFFREVSGKTLKGYKQGPYCLLV